MPGSILATGRITTTIPFPSAQRQISAHMSISLQGGAAAILVWSALLVRSLYLARGGLSDSHSHSRPQGEFSRACMLISPGSPKPVSESVGDAFSKHPVRATFTVSAPTSWIGCPASCGPRAASNIRSGTSQTGAACQEDIPARLRKSESSLRKRGKALHDLQGWRAKWTRSAGH